MLSAEAQAFFGAHGGAVIEHMDMLANANSNVNAQGALPSSGALASPSPAARLAQVRTTEDLNGCSLSELQGMVLHLRLMPLEQVSGASPEALTGALAGHLEQQKRQAAQ